MMTGKVAAVYAKTLFRAALEKTQVSQVLTDMQLVASVFARTRGIQRYLSNPVIKRESKASLLSEAFQKDFCDLSRRFLKLLEQKDRLDQLGAVAGAFIELERERRGERHALVTSAKALAEDQLERIRGLLDKMEPGKTFVVEQKIDDTLIGGFRVRVGDTVLDHSVQHKLAGLRRKLAA